MKGELRAAVDLISHPGFLNGLGIGTVAVAFLLVISLGTRRGPRGWALGFAGSVTVGVSILFEVDPMVYVFLGALTLAGLAGDVFVTGRDRSMNGPAKIGYWSAVLLGTIGLTSLFQVEEVGWARWILPLVTVGCGAGIWLLSRSGISESVGPMVAVSIAGMWVTVPETDMITVMVGAAIPFALATLPPLRAKAWVSGSLALSGTMAWMVLVEGVPRPWTITAGWAMLASLPLLGVLVTMRLGQYNKFLISVIHLVYVILVSRVADMTDSTLTVAVAALLLLGLGGVAAVVSARTYSPAELGS